ncbi:MAG: pitrilysin family protein [Clostridia bacterium]|nr:pitrilysin family protein [Clostridia bacterium]
MSNIYKINDEKFKSVYLSYNFIMPVNRVENSQNSVLGSVLGKACDKYRSQKEIERHLYSLYGADFNVNIEKLGDLYNIEFRIEFVNKKFLPKNIDVSKDCIHFLYDIIYHPYLVNGKFDESIVLREKLAILDIIKTRKDDKLRYSVQRMEEILCPDEAFGFNLYGDEDIIEQITAEALYKRYHEVINQSCVVVLLSGNLDGYDNLEDEVKSVFAEKLNHDILLKNLNYDVCTNHIFNRIEEIKETQDTAQSVLSLGMRIKDFKIEEYFAFNVYNTILGGTPSSKLFQNVREKESLAYTVRSRYYRFKPIFVIYAGIQLENYEKAKNLILKQVEDMKQGNITDVEFESAKESLLADLLEWNDSKIAISKMKMSNTISFGKENMTIEDMREKIRKVTMQDVVDVAQRVEPEKIFLLGGEINV